VSIFPSIEPTRREYDLGDFPMEEEVSWPGVGVRFRTGFDPLAVEGLTLTLTFEDLRETQMQQIRTHYNSRQGGTVPFTLPAVIWQGDSAPPVPSGTRWRYLAPPEENQKKGGWFDVTVPLEAQGFLATVPPLPVLSIAATSADKNEGDSGSTAFTFTVTRTGDTTGSSSATWTVTGSGATPASASDFTGAAFPTGTVSFAIGETSKTITVNVAGDTTDEPDEGFTVTLSAPSGATLGTATAVGVIRNDDAPPPISATYSQRSVYSSNTAATQAGMQNGITAETTQTGTNSHSDAAGAWLQMDFGSVTSFSSVVVGSDFDDTLAGGWGKFYTENCDIIGSDDATTWTTLGNTGTFSTAMKTISTPAASYRYVRIRKVGNFLAVTEFYALP
jgi:hypothetical protein